MSGRRTGRSARQVWLDDRLAAIELERFYVVYPEEPPVETRELLELLGVSVLVCEAIPAAQVFTPAEFERFLAWLRGRRAA